MPELMDDSVALTVTSPPYWNAIDYRRHADGAPGWYRTGEYEAASSSYEGYIAELATTFDEVKRVTIEGGFLAVIIGTLLRNGVSYPIPMDLTTALTRFGWEFHQDIIWHKTTAGVRRAGSAIKRPFPGYYYPNIMTEYVLVFRKPGPRIYANVDRQTREASRFEIDAVFAGDTANNVWHIAPVPPGVVDHPCPFPEEIPFRLIRLYSHQGDIVLDPFLGSGQTTKVARALGRIPVGFEIEPIYARTAMARMSQPLRIRPKQLVARFDHVDVGEPTKSLAHNGSHGLPIPIWTRSEVPKAKKPG
jgi:site-specific DNA-methyltransferase (adenine-specific)